MDPLAEIQQHLKQLTFDQLCVESILETVSSDNEFHAWVDDRASELLDRIRQLAICDRDYHARASASCGRARASSR